MKSDSLACELAQGCEAREIPALLHAQKRL